METIFETMGSYFRKNGWEVAQLDDESVLQMRHKGENGAWTCYAQAREIQQQFAFYSVCSTLTPEDRLPAMAEFLTRANFSMVIGNFEMDWNDGEVRYKTSINVEGDRLSDALLTQLVRANILMMDTYLPGILAVSDGSLSPAEAINRIED